MAYLNAQQRLELLEELRTLSFNQARGRLRRMDKKSRLVFYRNAQTTGRWMTRFDLEGLGTRVILVEENRVKDAGDDLRSDWQMVEVVVEPTPDNRT